MKKRIPNRWVYFSLLITLLLPSAVMAGGLDCATLPKSTVKVNVIESGIQPNYDYSFVSLKAMTERYVDPTVEVLGLTVGTAVVRTEINSRVLQDSNGGRECSTHDIVIHMGFAPITVYVGKEFPQGSCAFSEIYKHEMRHAEIYQAHARNVIAQARETIKARFEGQGPLRGVIGATQERVASELSERWVPYLRRVLAKAEIEQRAVDTREEYERVAASCQGEIKKTIKATMR